MLMGSDIGNSEHFAWEIISNILYPLHASVKTMDFLPVYSSHRHVIDNHPFFKNTHLYPLNCFKQNTVIETNFTSISFCSKCVFTISVVNSFVNK